VIDSSPSLFDVLSNPPREVPPLQEGTARMEAARQVSRQAAQKGIESAEMNCDPEWFQSALDTIRDMPTGRQFLAEEIVCALRERGIETYDNRAAGAVIRAAKSHKLIVSCGARPAASSHGSLKYQWERCES
jgi:hypothetical protein